MREILFRGKDASNGKWVEGYLASATWYLDDSSRVVIFPTDVTLYPHSEFSEYYEVDPETVGQFTGLLDKNGKKIFEGDVVRIDEYAPLVNGVYEVCYSDFNHEWCLRRNSVVFNRAYFSFSDLNCFEETSDVVGNIHDKVGFLLELLEE